MSEQNTEKSKTPYIIGVIILVVVGWYIWGGSNTCTLADNEDHVCAESNLEGCEGYVELTEEEVAAAKAAEEAAAAAAAAEEATAAAAAAAAEAGN